jgi:23S rRNA (cytidine1920-2'-O)/16S rRNA (cytidine1409-2'-O)-methyltransferase
MNKLWLSKAIVAGGLAASRSQADSYIKLGYVSVNDKMITRSDRLINENDAIKLEIPGQYVSRGALKLASVAQALKLDFRGKLVLDIGSSTGGFTDYALQHGANKVVAVDAGTNQLHPRLMHHPKIELHEKTDIRDFKTKLQFDVVLIDVSFITLREILPNLVSLLTPKTDIIAMVKPQFEATGSDLKHKGIIKNDRIRRDILKDFEIWSKGKFMIVNKADSDVAGAKGNRERFYHLRLIIN